MDEQGDTTIRLMTPETLQAPRDGATTTQEHEETANVSMPSEMTVETTQAPNNRFLHVALIFALHGVGTLYPWNAFITAEKFFTDHKFANVSDDADFKDKFTIYVGYANFTPYVLFLFGSLFIPPRISNRTTLFGLATMLLLFIITTVLALVDSSQWPHGFFVTTMFIVVVFSAASAVYQSGMYALAAKLGSIYIQSYIVGQGFGGTFVAISSMISIASAGSVKNAAISYFTCAVVILLFCIITHRVLFTMRMVKISLKSWKIKYEEEVVENRASLAALRQTSKTLWAVFKKIKMQAFNIWFTYFITLAIFPAVLVGIPSSAENPSEFLQKFFVPFVCFFTFNLGDFLGSLIPYFFKGSCPRWMWIPVTIRLLFYPLFIFCNYQPSRRSLPVVFEDDVAYATFVIIFSLSNGYLKTRIMLDGPKSVTHKEQESTAASMMIFFLVLGIFCGIQFSRFFTWVITV